MSMLPCLRNGDWKEIFEEMAVKAKEVRNRETPGIRMSDILDSYPYQLLTVIISRRLMINTVRKQ